MAENLCKVSRNGDGADYTAYFDKKYNKKPKDLPVRFPFSLNNCGQVSALVEAIPELKYRMDNFLTKHGKSEREFQQLVVRENNYSPIAGKTHYFIVDIEIAGILPGARYDMLAVRWLSHERNLPGALVPALIEMKYGTDALDGLAGLKKHMDDAYALRGKGFSIQYAYARAREREKPCPAPQPQVEQKPAPSLNAAVLAHGGLALDQLRQIVQVRALLLGGFGGGCSTLPPVGPRVNFDRRFRPQ